MNNSIKKYSIWGLAILALGFGACERVIDVDLNEAEPTLVVEATINNTEGPHEVLLTQTTSFFTADDPGLVENATVVVTDSEGDSYAYTQVSSGRYQAEFTGVPGRTYTLEIQAGGVTYTAVSEMRQPVTLDSLNFVPGGWFWWSCRRSSYLLELCQFPRSSRAG